ncbi:unnamed protein product [Trichogramma brassicae]|uniref:Uncharacterized protein n=1 Tax=Trichogramma brassicae TaxID=86971 RepID=A0A6H5J5M2_9HYME|nr:unnamed protein product [Trichogramma brassicae]
MAQDHQNSSKTSLLREMRENVDWKNEGKRLEFLENLFTLIENWIDGLPNLRDIFQQDEIELLLEDYINNDYGVDQFELVDRFIEFVISTGYKDELKLDEDRNPVLHRNTPVHSAGRKENPWLSFLFKIYDRFDVNYVDERGYTHFHAACQYGCDYVVEKFLEFGQDPNIIWQETGDSPLHLALKSDRKEMFEMLLKKGADPTLSNAEGSTPLHLISFLDVDVDYAKIIFEINNDIRARLVSARDKVGWTPLYVAMKNRCIDLMEWLLTKGADPNAVNDNGETPLHIISRYAKTDDLARMFFWSCDEKKKTLQLDAKDKRGWTPLHLAMRSGYLDLIELLLTKGADPNAVNVDGKTPLHVICDQDDDKKAKLFFEICEERKQIVQLEAKGRYENFLVVSLYLRYVYIIPHRCSAKLVSRTSTGEANGFYLVVSRHTSSRSDRRTIFKGAAE